LGVRIREEKRERRKVAIHKYMRSGINLGLSALLLAVSLCFYAVTIRSGGKQLDPIESLSVITVNRVNQYLTTQLPGFRPTMTVNEFLFLVAVKGSQQAKPAGAATIPESLTTGQNVKVGVAGDVPDWIGVDINDINKQIEGISEQQLMDQLPADFLEQVKRNPQLLTDKFIQLQSGMIGQQVDQARNEIASQFNIQVGSNEQIGVVLERAIAQKYRDLFGPFVYLIPPLLALGLFFILQIFNFIFVIITMFFARILFIGLRWAGFYRITEHSAPTEVLELD
jgi:cytochrome c-type biogenesis protein CcmH/NrfF